MLPDTLGICRLVAPEAFWWGADRAGFQAVIRTPDETTVICEDGLIPPGVQVERGFRALQVAGPLDFDAVGIVARLAAALAEVRVPVFVVSSYDTDYLLVRGEHLGTAADALRRAGHDVLGA